MDEQRWQRVFADVHKFQDDVWGQITLNTLERDVIDTPEFQRLFRTSQLGFIDLVYQTANHTRGAHSIGACHVAADLMNRLAKNTAHDGRGTRYAPIEISPAERILIRLGALLHDISHVPFSHDVERKSHLIWYNQANKEHVKIRSHYGHYDKHDDYDSNPLLYLLLFDTCGSVLARVLRAYSEPFFEMLTLGVDAGKHRHLESFLSLLDAARTQHHWRAERELLPALLFHLLMCETEEQAKHSRHMIITSYSQRPATPSPWGLGPEPLHGDLHEAWYQPFRHDIIGNTLSADLIDYLKRDMRRLGMDREVDLHLLNYYVLVNPDAGEFHQGKTNSRRQVTALTSSHLPRYRCAIEIQDHKRGTSRTVLINDIFRLLDLRHEIHEKAVTHRVVQSAIAMFSRALSLLGAQKPAHEKLVNLGDDLHGLHGDDVFLHSLVSMVDERGTPLIHSAPGRIIGKLLDRRVYRPLVIIPGDRAAEHFRFSGNKDDESTDPEYRLRTLAAVIDCTYYSPLLLFVSTCIEEFLLGLFDTDRDLLEAARRAVHDTTSRARAMASFPSRVIIWTAPYKQLYKDPAVVVALKHTVDRIDEIGRLKPGDVPGDASLVKLIRASIDAADMKYSTIWKLYVFISDGLYYTGILNKLRAASRNGKATPAYSHIDRLKSAEALVVAVLDIICKDWSAYCQLVTDADDRKARLVGKMPEDRFVALVDLWLAEYRAQESRQTNPTRGLSEVDIQHYVHEWDSTGCPVEDKCRDIRYKYPAAADEAWRQAKREPPSHREWQLVAFLERCGITDPTMISRAEFEQLLGQFDEATAQRCQKLLRDSPIRLDDACLKVLWPSKLQPSDTRPAPAAEDGWFDEETDEETLPRTPQTIERWLLQEARVLEPHVRKQFTTNASTLAQLIHSYPPTPRRRIFRDLRTRLLNESRLLTNNMRLDELIPQLRRGWDRLIGLDESGHTVLDNTASETDT